MNDKNELIQYITQNSQKLTSKDVQQNVQKKWGILVKSHLIANSNASSYEFPLNLFCTVYENEI